MPGGGKSTIGRQLARRLSWNFVDVDSLIEKQIGCSIKVFFDREGEEAFRDLEQRAITDLTAKAATVIATGGGAVLREANRNTLRDHFSVVYLSAAPEDLFRRIKHDTKRPLLQVSDPLARLRELHAARHALYSETAHFSIETGRPSIATLVNMILMQLELAGLIDPSNVPSPIDADSAAP
jgi:shikimate kinase